jgi:hypothetical protein
MSKISLQIGRKGIKQSGGRLVPQVIKSSQSQSHDFDFFQNPKKVKVMTLTLT